MAPKRGSSGTNKLFLKNQSLSLSFGCLLSHTISEESNEQLLCIKRIFAKNQQSLLLLTHQCFLLGTISEKSNAQN